MVIEIREDLYLCPLEPEMAPELFIAVESCREYLRRWLPWVDGIRNPDDALLCIQNAREDMRRGRELILGVFYNGNLSGAVGIHRITRPDNRAMLGYWLCEDLGRRGIMTDCVRAAINYSFSRLGLHRVSICCSVHNLQSRGVAMKLGFEQEGILKEALNLYGQYHDLIIYSMLSSRWAETLL